MQEFLKFIATVMEVPPSEITLDTEYGKFEKWDSLMHMRLVMEIEDKYGVEIPIDKVPEIKTLRDLYNFTKV